MTEQRWGADFDADDLASLALDLLLAETGYRYTLNWCHDDQPVRFALLKGWRNYVCLSRLQHARAHVGSLLEPDRRDELDTVARWARTTRAPCSPTSPTCGAMTCSCSAIWPTSRLRELPV